MRQVLANHGGILFLQQLALLGFIYGFVDVLVKLDTLAAGGGGPANCRRPAAAPGYAAGAGGGSTEGTSARVASGGGDAPPLPSSDTGAGIKDSGTEVPLPVDIGEDREIDSAGDCRALRAPCPFSPTSIGDVSMPMHRSGKNPNRQEAKRKHGFLSKWLRSSFNRIVPRSDCTVMEIISPTAWQRYRNGAAGESGR